MKKNLLLFLLLSIFAFVIYGCSDSSDDETETNTDIETETDTDSDSDDTGGSSSETIPYEVTPDDRQDILDAFTEELIKYTTFNEDEKTELTSTGIANLESILEDLEETAGEVLYAEIARNIARTAASSLSDILYSSVIDGDTFSTLYGNIDLTTDTQYVASVATQAKRMVDNAESMIGFVDYLESYFSSSELTDNGRANMIYMIGSFLGYLDDTYMSGLAEHYVLPNNSEFLQALAEAFYNLGSYVQDYDSWNVDYVNESFSVMLILTDGVGIAAGMSDMLAFMTELVALFNQYGY